MARLIVDENIRGNVLDLLRDDGHDVLSIYETARGMPDEDVLMLAVRESRILVTPDKTDFGALIYQEQSPPPLAVILFRIPYVSVGDVPRFISESITLHDDWEGYFWVIDEHGVRARPLPD